MPYPDELYDKLPNIKGHHEMAEFLKDAIWQVRRIQSAVGTNINSGFGDLSSRLKVAENFQESLNRSLNDRTIELNQRIDDLAEDLISQIEVYVQSLEDTDTELGKLISDNSDKIDGTIADYKKADIELSAYINSEITSTESQLENLIQKTSSSIMLEVNSNYDALQNSIKSVNTDLDTLKNQIDATQKSIDNLKEVVSSYEQNLDGLIELVDEMQTSIDESSKSITSLERDIERLECRFESERKYTQRVARIAIQANRRSIRNYWKIRKHHGRF